MAEVNNVNLNPVIPSQNQTDQIHISTDRKTFMLMIEQELKKLVNDYADPSTSSIVIDGRLYADKFSAGTTLALNRHITRLETGQTTFNTVYQSMVKFEKDISGLLSG